MFVTMPLYIAIMVALGFSGLFIIFAALRINKLERDVKRYRERIWALSKS